MLEKAVRLCEAKFGNIYRWDGEALHIRRDRTIRRPPSPRLVGAHRYRPYPNPPIGRMVADKTVAHIADITAEEVLLAQRDPIATSAVVELGGIRTLLGVPIAQQGRN